MSAALRVAVIVTALAGAQWAGSRGQETGTSAPSSPPDRVEARSAGGAPGSSFTAADFDAHVKKLERRLPAGFTVALAPPFVVVGDEAPETVRRRARDTVAWAVRKLKEAYFEEDPLEIIDVWLFKSEESYRHHTKLLFDETPTTPFGYYSPEHRALIMNIATGGGTLVHEIVHPFMSRNFPACPAWFNEGLASLYEQSGEESGAIRGYTNWRLEGLQRAIKSGTVPSFGQLTSTDDDGFYRRDPGTNYAQARYLCYFLQEHDLLRRYYREFRGSAGDDPTGYDALRRVLGPRGGDMIAFEEEWRKFVLGLEFR